MHIATAGGIGSRKKNAGFFKKQLAFIIKMMGDVPAAGSCVCLAHQHQHRLCGCDCFVHDGIQGLLLADFGIQKLHPKLGYVGRSAARQVLAG